MADQNSKQAKEPSFWDKVEREWNKVATKLDDIFTPEENKDKEGQKKEQNGQPSYVNHSSPQAQNYQQPPPLPPKHAQSQQAPPLPPKHANGTDNTHSQSEQKPKEEKGLVKDLEKAGNAVAKWFDDLGNKLDKAIDGDKTTAKK